MEEDAMPRLQPASRRCRDLALLLVAGVVSGATARAQHVRWWLENRERYETIALRLTWLDDVDGDTVPEVATSSFSNFISGDSGNSCTDDIVWIRSGKTLEPLTAIRRPVGSWFGVAMARTSDHDGDSIGDLWIAQQSDHDGRGRALLHSTATGELLREIVIDDTPDWTGVQLQTLDDVDGDGLDELVVGLPKTAVGRPHAGSIRVIGTSDGATLATWFSDDHGSLGARSTFCTGHDVDGDGRRDLFIAEWIIPSPGTPNVVVRIFSGADFSLLATRSIVPPSSAGLVGVSSTSDINVDGIAEVVLLTGSVIYFLSGSSLATVRSISFPQPMPLRADAVMGLDDVNGDGRGDVAVTFSKYDFPNQTFELELRVYGGKDGRVLKTFNKSDTWYYDYPWFEVAEGGPADWDADGKFDLLYAFTRTDFFAGISPDQKVEAYSIWRNSVLASAPVDDEYLEFRSHILFADVDGDGVQETLSREVELDGDYLYMVSVRSGVDGHPLHRRVVVRQDNLSLNLEQGLMVLPDIDGDTIAEFAVPVISFGANRVEICSGATGFVVATLQESGRVYVAGATSRPAADGTFHLALADPNYREPPGSKGGLVTAWAMPAATKLWSRSAESLGINLYSSVACVDDVDSDQVADWAVPTDGAIAVLSGVDGHLVAQLDPGAWAGRDRHSLAVVPDSDGDGTSHLLAMFIPSSGYGGGAFSVFELPSLVRTSRTSVPERVSPVIAGVDDMNGDGHDEALVAGQASFRSLVFDTATGSRLGAIETNVIGSPVDFTTAVPFVALADTGGGQRSIAVHDGRTRGIGLYELPDLLLAVEPRTAKEGDVVTATVGAGPPGAMVGIYVPFIDDVPFAQFLALDVLDATGTFVMTDTVPPGVAGMTYVIRAFAVGYDGRLSQSHDEELQLR
jgi:hypothetical protein